MLNFLGYAKVAIPFVSAKFLCCKFAKVLKFDTKRVQSFTLFLPGTNVLYSFASNV